MSRVGQQEATWFRGRKMKENGRDIWVGRKRREAGFKLKIVVKIRYFSNRFQI